jgi:hypothetical protein
MKEEVMSETDAYLTIVLPGMGDWEVEEVESSGEVIGYQIRRSQVAAFEAVGKGNEHRLEEVRIKMQARAAALNKAQEPLVLSNGF